MTRLTIAIVAGSISVCLAAVAARAQGGSTGGAIGKTEKSISGAQEAPAAPERRQSKKPTRESPAAAVSVTGRWHWVARCQSGHWTGDFILAESSAGQFTGAFGGTNWADAGTIANGRASAGNVVFTRLTTFVTQYWTAKLTDGRMVGSLSGNENCQWEASRK
jgi:hypothetical protein